MFKRILMVLLLFTLFGCSNTTNKEEDKSEYIAIKSNLLEEKEYMLKEELPLDIEINIDRMDESKVDYSVVFSNPDENLHDIEAMVVHNYYNEDMFPTLGLFNDKGELLKDSDEVIKLKDIINTNKNLGTIGLELKIYIKYIDDDGNKKEIYYKTT